MVVLWICVCIVPKMVKPPFLMANGELMKFGEMGENVGYWDST